MGILDKVILGVHDGHDAAACIVQGGRILCAISEERPQRVKSVGGFPLGAIEACLAHTGLTRADIDHVALAGSLAVPLNMLGTLSTLTIPDYVRIQEELRYPHFHEGRDVSFSALFPDYRPRGNPYYPLDKVPLKETREMTPAELAALAEFRLDFVAEHCGVPRDKILTFDHHLCHAYYAYYAAPFRDEPVTVLTLDGGGDRLRDTVSLADETGKLTRLHASADCIVGLLYSIMTLALNMRPHEHEYKVMGLAPYAKEHVKKKTRETLIRFMELDGIKFTRNPEIKELYWTPKELLKCERFDGIAGGLQDFAEHFLTRWVENAIAKTGTGKVAYAGGVALNVKANRKIAALDGLESLFIPPGPGDESLPIGAAWALMDQLNPDGSHRAGIEPLPNGYMGPDFSSTEIERFRAHPNVRGRFEEVPGDPDLLVCDALAEGEIVALCRGRMEFGPRALGHRSLVASADSPDIVRRINETIKGRDFWMPFAPSILHEHIDDYLTHSGRADLSYMAVSTGSTELGREHIHAGLHPYDQTCRVQSVKREQAPDYHALLTRFHERTGRAGVLNTSLNIHGKPIVMNPVDIAEELLGEESVVLDCVLVDDRYFRRKRPASGG